MGESDRPVRRRLLADIGGTNARFAISDRPGRVDRIERMTVRAHATFTEAISAYVAALDGGLPVTEACIAAAGPVRDGAIRLTNADWQIAAEAVRPLLGAGGSVRLYNDLEAVALALPHLGADGRETLRPGATTTAPMLALNVGTGLGAAAIHPVRGVPGGGAWRVAASEAGHMAFSAADGTEADMLGRFATFEDALSGAGVVRLYQHVCGVLGHDVDDGISEARDVFEAAAGKAAARAAVERFTRLLGRIAGDLVLASGAWGGVFLCGSVVDGWLPGASRAAFFAAFDAKGLMRERISAVPVHRITKADPAFLGLSHA